MKKTFALVLSVFSFIFTVSAFAQRVSPAPSVTYSMPAVEVGFKWNTAKVTNSISDKQEVGFQLGISTVLNFSESFGVKSGLFYSERPSQSELSATSTVKGKITYFDVPLLLMYKIEDYAGVYVGPSLAIKLGDESTPSGSMTDVKSMVMPITFGAQFKFTPVLGANVFFETIPGDVAKDVSNSRAVGVNLLFTLD